MRGGLLRGQDAAGGEHHERLRQPGLRGGRRQRAQVASATGGPRYASAAVVDARSYSRNSGATSCDATTWTPGWRRAQLARDGLLVRRVAKREEEADRDRLGLVELGERVEVERLELALRPEPAPDAVAPLERDERLRMLGAEAVEVRARLAPQMEQVLEARVRDVGDAGAAPLEQRVRGNRRAVREARQPAACADDLDISRRDA